MRREDRGSKEAGGEGKRRGPKAQRTDEGAGRKHGRTESNTKAK